MYCDRNYVIDCIFTKELIQAFASQDAPPDVVSHTLKALPLVALQECLEECK